MKAPQIHWQSERVDKQTPSTAKVSVGFWHKQQWHGGGVITLQPPSKCLFLFVVKVYINSSTITMVVLYDRMGDWTSVTKCLAYITMKYL